MEEALGGGVEGVGSLGDDVLAERQDAEAEGEEVFLHCDRGLLFVMLGFDVADGGAGLVHGAKLAS